MVNDPLVSFGDRVRIRSTPLTQNLNLAALVGMVQGETTPSVTGVEVTGESTTDHAIYVFFEEREQGFWFASNLLEFVDHAPGTEIRINEKRWVRSESGEWESK